ncbi:MAG TPA: Uma2 family endonuclease [Hyphomicrobiaceae bacterium]|nr:Uma2 family endonuclease [Hyphomicrobiaceae bacterium]
MSAIRELKRSTVEDYLAVDAASPIGHEFRDSVIYARGGATNDHGRLAGNLFAATHGVLPPRCDVFMGDMRLKLRALSDDAYYYPDVLATCSDLDRARDSDVYYPGIMVSCAASDRDRMFRREPILLIEVLSPSTGRLDRSEKRLKYLQIPTLQEFVLVAHDRPMVEILRRRTSWLVEEHFPGDTLTLESVGISLPLAEIYRTNTF